MLLFILLTDRSSNVLWHMLKVRCLHVEKIGEVGKVRWELAGEVVPPEVSAKPMDTILTLPDDSAKLKYVPLYT